jgi:hypothetical protein
MLYELQTLMVPIVNFTKHPESPSWKGRTFPPGYEALARIPWRGPGCTGIIAKNQQDGTVWHARNLDFAPVPFMTHLVFNGIFKKNGKEVFRSQMIAGYTQIITGYRPGGNGWAVERNTRYTDHWGGNSEMLGNLFAGSVDRPLTGWTLRKALETKNNYDDAVVSFFFITIYSLKCILFAFLYLSSYIYIFLTLFSTTTKRENLTHSYFLSTLFSLSLSLSLSLSPSFFYIFHLFFLLLCRLT